MHFDEFRLERFFSKHEFNAPYLMCCSDCESFTIQELLDLEDDSGWPSLANLRLCYTESRGDPELRQRISKMYHGIDEEEVLVTAGAEEAIFLFTNSMLAPGDHAIVQHPCYQSLYEVARSIGCQITKWEMREEQGWRPDLDFLADSVRNNTRLIVINNPHNPTGYLMSDAELNSVLELAEKNGPQNQQTAPGTAVATSTTALPQQTTTGQTTTNPEPAPQSQASTPASERADDVYFVDRHTGYLAATLTEAENEQFINELWKTSDGGHTWIHVYSGAALSSLQFPSGDVGYAIETETPTGGSTSTKLRHGRSYGRQKQPVEGSGGGAWTRQRAQPSLRALSSLGGGRSAHPCLSLNAGGAIRGAGVFGSSASPHIGSEKVEALRTS